jgi:pyrroloquinoline quinone biosynthesis protein E
MTLDDLHKFLEKKRIKSPARICLYGGEPLLNVDSMAMIKLLGKKGFFTSIITNGVLLPSLYKELIDSGLHFMTLSYYQGVSEKIKSEVTAVGTKIILNISYIISRKKIEKLEEVIKYAIEVGAKMITIENLVEKENHDDQALWLSHDYRRNKRELLNKYSSKIIFRWSDVKKINQVESKTNCTEFWDMMVINRKGQLLPCCQYPLSEFSEDGFIDSKYYNNKKIVSLRKKMILNSPPERCRGCHYLYAKDPLYRFDL